MSVLIEPIAYPKNENIFCTVQGITTQTETTRGDSRQQYTEVMCVLCSIPQIHEGSRSKAEALKDLRRPLHEQDVKRRSHFEGKRLEQPYLFVVVGRLVVDAKELCACLLRGM